MAYAPSCSTRISAILRILPLLAPRVVKIATGSPVSRRVLASRPPVASYRSTWSRTHLGRAGLVLSGQRH